MMCTLSVFMVPKGAWEMEVSAFLFFFACRQNPFKQEDASARGRASTRAWPAAQQPGPVLRRREENLEDPHK